MTRYTTVIGLEIHCELNTKTKIFCNCKNGFAREANTHCCPYCSGMPGMLPVLNREVVTRAIKAGFALNCRIANYSKFDRKHYFYPDLAGGYQITQLSEPICLDGYMDVDAGESKRIRINRIHIEEDAGKLLHDEYGDSSYLDYNRLSTPLIEIVTEPDIRSSEEAREFLEQVRNALLYVDVSDCKMEEGSLRCDVNISVMPEGSTEFGVRTEMKNLNSFRSVVRAIEYESKRHIDLIENGEAVRRETRRWDDASGKTYAMRSKEQENDYRYFPDPDLPPIVLTDEHIESIRITLPEMPDARQKRYIEQYGLPVYDAKVLTASKEVSDYFDAVVAEFPKYKTVSNFIMRDLMKLINDSDGDINKCQAGPKALAKLLKQVDEGKINLDSAKLVLEEMFTNGGDPEAIIQQKGLAQISDTSAITELIREAIANNPNVVADYKAGKEKALTFFVGQVMKATKGKANPQIVNQIAKEELARS